MNVFVKMDFIKILKMMFASMWMNATQTEMQPKCSVKIHMNAQIRLALMNVFARRVLFKFSFLKCILFLRALFEMVQTYHHRDMNRLNSEKL